MKTSTMRFALALVLLILLATPAHAQDPPTQPATQGSVFDREMTVSPAKAEDADSTRRAGFFAFSQDALELRHENAATLYLQGFPMLQRRYGDQQELLQKLADQAIHEMDRAAAQELMGSTGVEITEPSVRRTYADWGAPIRELGIETLLPYLSDCRLLARVLVLEARLLALEGKHTESAQRLQRAFVLAQHLGEANDAVLVDGLVGVGVAAMALDGTAQIAQLPDAPNRYWSLTTLPRPMFELSHWLRAERLWVAVSLPTMRNPEAMTADRWEQTVRKLNEYISLSPEDDRARETMQRLSDPQAMKQIATRYYKEQGMADPEIAAMGDYPLLARFVIDEYSESFNAMAKLVHLPFPQGDPLIEQLEQTLIGRGIGAGSVLTDLMLPSFRRAYASPYRLERQIAALRIVEAIRDHAAHNNGALPATLEEVRLPISEDPMTGEPFGYEVNGNSFTITARRYQENDPNSGFVWGVTMRR